MLGIVVLMWISHGVGELSRKSLMRHLREDTRVTMAIDLPRTRNAETIYKDVEKVVLPKLEDEVETRKTFAALEA